MSSHLPTPKSKVTINKSLRKATEKILDYAAKDAGALVVIVTLFVGLVISVAIPVKAANLHNYIAYGFVLLIELSIRSLGTARRVDQLAENAEDTLRADKELVSNLQGILDTRKFLYSERYVQHDFMQGAQTLNISGITLNRTLDDNIGHIRNALRDNGHVKILLTAVTESLVREFPLRFEPDAAHDDNQKLVRRLRDACDTINTIIEDDSGSEFNGILECGVMTFMMPCGIVDVKDHRGSWRVRCEIYHRKSTSGQTAFYLDASEGSSESWCGFFHDTFEAYWRIAQRMNRTMKVVDHGTCRPLPWVFFTDGEVDDGP
jgi:hypothetical protein